LTTEINITTRSRVINLKPGPPPSGYLRSVEVLTAGDKATFARRRLRQRLPRRPTTP
jgi:hypothetical protein